MAKGIGVICKARKFLNKKTLITLYYSFIYPYVHYGIIAWGNTYSVYLDPLIKMQKKAVRIISSASRDAHTEPLFKDLKLLNLANVYALNVLLFMFKHYHGLLPDVFGNMFCINATIHDHFTRQFCLYHTSYWRLEIVRRSIRIQGVRYWNFMYDNIVYECSQATYKINMKRFLIGNTLQIT